MDGTENRYVTTSQLAMKASCNERQMRARIRESGISADAVLESPFGQIPLFDRAHAEILCRAKAPTTNHIA